MVSFWQAEDPESPHRISRLQEVQSEIYRQLQLLIPDESSFYDHLASRVPGSPLLRMEILERHPYTTFFRLTYEFSEPEDAGARFAPDAHVRFYRDARLAEAVSFDCEQACRRESHPAFPARQLMQRAWRRNRALDRWLDYLLHQGHSAVTMRPSAHAAEASKPLKKLATVA